MPRTKVDDTERKRQRRAASPSERGRRSERAPRSKARNAERMHQERAPSRTSSADAASQALSKKTRARAHPPLRSVVCCVDNGTGARSAAKMPTACLRRFVEEGRNGLWPLSRDFFLEDRSMERSTCVL